MGNFNDDLRDSSIMAAKPTYSASAKGVASAASATDIFIINGSASKTIKITKLIISGIATAATAVQVLLIKRSTANSGGTAATPTCVPHDSADSAATAVVQSYTANPTPGTAVGEVACFYLDVAGTSAVAGSYVFEKWSYGNNNKPITLKGAAQGLAVNLNGVTVSGGAFDITVEWTEE